MPGFGSSPANERTGSLRELGATILAAVDAVGLEGFDLWGTSFGGKLAPWIAIDAPQRIQALVLAAPAAIRTSTVPPEDPAELAAILYHHPERRPPSPPPSPEGPPRARLRRRARLDADRPEAFAAVVGDFLEHHGQFVVRRESGLLYP